MAIPQGAPVHLIVQKNGTLSFKLAVLSDKNNPLSVIDISGYTGKAEIRKSSGGDLLLALTVNLTDPVNGEVTVSATPIQTNTLLQDGVWDLFLSIGINRYKVCGGNVQVIENVTQFA